MRLIFKHLQHYNRPLLQRQVVRIILIVPVYAVCSALSLSFEHEAVYINTIRDIYEAYCIHCFLVLMLDFPGGEAAVVEGIKEKGLLKHPFPCGLCCSKIQLGAEFIVSMKRTTMQFVIIKPIMALLAIIFMLSGVCVLDGLRARLCTHFLCALVVTMPRRPHALPTSPFPQLQHGRCPIFHSRRVQLIVHDCTLRSLPFLSRNKVSSGGLLACL